MDRSTVVLGASIVIAALVIGGALIWSSVARDSSSLSDGLADPAPSNNPSADDDVILGDSSAPVTLIEFGDYQCPFCKKMFDETEGRLRDEYVKTGKLKMVYRDFPLDQAHPYARRAAEAAECARDEGKFWVYHDALFERQDKIPTLDFAVLAEELGLEKNLFASCLEAGKYVSEVEHDFQDGLAVGVQGTPANFIVAGGSARSLPGALPYETFKLFIDQALAETAR